VLIKRQLKYRGVELVVIVWPDSPSELALSLCRPHRRHAKRILRAALDEVVVRREGAIIDAVLHRQGGDHTALRVKQRLNAVGRHNPRTPEDTIALVRELAGLMQDRQIAPLLNRSGLQTGYGNGWT